MAVTAEDRFEVSISIVVKNKATGELVTETSHTDANLDYGSMQAFRQVAIGAINEKTGELGQALAESFGQPSLKNFLGNAMGRVMDRVIGPEENAKTPGPGVIR